MLKGADIGQQRIDLPVHMIGDIDADDGGRDGPFDVFVEPLAKAVRCSCGQHLCNGKARGRDAERNKEDRRIGYQVGIGLASVASPAEIAQQKDRHNRHAVIGEGVVHPPHGDLGVDCHWIVVQQIPSHR